MINAFPINSAPINSPGGIGGGKLLSVSAGAGAAAIAMVAVQRALAVSISGGVSSVSVGVLRTRGLGAALKCYVKKVVSDMDLYKSATGLTMTYLSVDTNPNVSINAAILNTKNFGVNAVVSASVNAVVAIQRALGAVASAFATAFDSGFYSQAKMSANVRVQPIVGRKLPDANTFGYIIAPNPNLQVSRGLSVAVSVGASIASIALDFAKTLGAAINAGASIIADLFKDVELADVDCTATADIADVQMTRIRGLGANISVGASTDTGLGVELFVNEFARAPSARIVRVPFRYRSVVVPSRPRQDIVEPH